LHPAATSAHKATAKRTLARKKSAQLAGAVGIELIEGSDREKWGGSVTKTSSQDKSKLAGQ
jgi:hypothetical protein